MALDLRNLLVAIPATLRDELLKAYQEIAQNYVEERWEPAELNGGKFSEVVYCIAKGALTSTYPATATKPKDMVAACKALEAMTADPARVGDRSFRILIPRILPPLYEIRNNRGVGHVGGDVDPNHADAELVLAMANWTLAELIRIYHSVSVAEAQIAIDVIVEKRHPLVWSSGGTKRVLDPKMPVKSQTLVLLYSESDWVSVETLCAWTDYSSLAMFRSRVLAPLHKGRIVEHDEKKKIVRITPLGLRKVEAELLPKRA